MIIKVIDSFDTLNLPEIPDLPEISKKEQLSEDLQNLASNLVSICSCKVRDSGEDIDIASLKEIAKVALDVQKAFFDNKQTNVQVNNIQNNVSNTQLHYFKGIMKNEI